MKSATVIAFPSEHTVPTTDPEKWVMCLEYIIPTLDPIQVIVREHGKPPRVIRIDAEAIPEGPRRMVPPVGADWTKILARVKRR
jgi:hypothetical protein